MYINIAYVFLVQFIMYTINLIPFRDGNMDTSKGVWNVIYWVPVMVLYSSIYASGCRHFDNSSVQEHWLFCKHRSLEFRWVLLPNLKPSRVLVETASGIPCVGSKKTTGLFLTDPFILLQLNFYHASCFVLAFPSST